MTPEELNEYMAVVIHGLLMLCIVVALAAAIWQLFKD